MVFILKIAQSLFLFSVILLTTVQAVHAHDISAGQTAVLITDNMSKAQCVRVAHQVCDQVFGSCGKNDEAALGGTYGYKVLYQCHYVRRTRGSDVALVIAGSRTADTNPSKLSKLMKQSHSLAGRLMR